jgi:hypothetical protein
MSVTMLPLAAEPAATTPTFDSASLLEELATLRLENAALRTENAVLHERVRVLEVRLGQTSANSSRPPRRIRPRHRRARKPRHPGANAAANQAITACTGRCCRSSRSTP